MTVESARSPAKSGITVAQQHRVRYFAYVLHLRLSFILNDLFGVSRTNRRAKDICREQVI